MTYTANELYKLLGFKALYSIISVKFHGQKEIRKLRGIQVRIERFIKWNPFTVTLPDNLLGSVWYVNKMVKLEGFPNNFRNSFYCKKQKLIKELYNEGKVDKVIDSGDTIRFIIGDYSFHQLKKCCPWLTKFDGTEEYIEQPINGITIDREKYDEALCGIIVYLLKNNKVKVNLM